MVVEDTKLWGPEQHIRAVQAARAVSATSRCRNISRSTPTARKTQRRTRRRRGATTINSIHVHREVAHDPASRRGIFVLVVPEVLADGRVNRKPTWDVTETGSPIMDTDVRDRSAQPYADRWLGTTLRMSDQYLRNTNRHEPSNRRRALNSTVEALYLHMAALGTRGTVLLRGDWNVETD